MKDHGGEPLTNFGITYANPYATIAHAQAVCRELSFGTPHSRVVDMVRVDYPSPQLGRRRRLRRHGQHDVLPQVSVRHTPRIHRPRPRRRTATACPG
ncbi:DUF732 domain-containing protein [Mycobacterium sp. 4D054]|uniref:DUF732 domain-containing protein n=1 Tax=Mycobacterium sp. 4D054 TaxID=3457440 RepID=UPI003FD0089B